MWDFFVGWLFVLKLGDWWAQNWYTNIKIGLTPLPGEICFWATSLKPFWLHVHPHELICLLVVNLKMVIKVTGVFDLEVRKTICYKISKWYYYQPYLENSNSARNNKITFHLCSYFKQVSSNFLHFTKIKPLEVMKSAFCFN